MDDLARGAAVVIEESKTIANSACFWLLPAWFARQLNLLVFVADWVHLALFGRL